MLHYHLSTIILAALALTAIAALLKRPTRQQTLTEKSPLEARAVMSANEREAYRRLIAALPRHLVLPQVSLASFIQPKTGTPWALRNYYKDLTADFLICTADSTPLAVIEIDDRSHAREKAKLRDRKKDTACKAARLTIVRWKATPLPSTETIQTTLAPILNAER